MLTILAFLVTGHLSRVDRNVVYSRINDLDLKMDVYYPPGLTKPVGAVVMLHGGAWIGGSRDEMSEIAESAATAGLLVANISYRLAPKYKWPAMIVDAESAVRYLRFHCDQYRIQPDRIGAVGFSAGAQIALLLGMTENWQKPPMPFPGYSSRVNAVIDISGPTDLTNGLGPSLDAVYPLVLGKNKQDALNECRKASPVNLADMATVPIYLIHGAQDSLVPLSQAKALEAKLTANKTVSVSEYLPDVAHSLAGSAIKGAIRRALGWMAREFSNK